MAKSTQKKSKNDEITCTKIHEFLRSTQFAQDLYYDIMSDIKDKPTYKRLKAMMKELISKTVDEWSSIPVNPSESESKKSVIAEISITAFTIDAIFPAMTYNFVHSKFDDITTDIHKEVSQELMNGNESLSESHKVDGCSEINHIKSGLNTVSNGDTSKNAAPKRKRGRPQKMQSTPQKVTTPEVDSDAESVISVGNLSLPSVSSVHTSELSSFDDEISLSSDYNEENSRKRRKLSLNAIQEMHKEGRISQWCAENLNSKSYTENTKDNTISEPVKNVAQETEAFNDVYSTTATSSQPSIQKTLPQRVRKPNSKYSSESIYCPIAEKHKKINQVNGSDENTPESENCTSPKAKQKKNKEDREAKSPNKTQDISFSDEKKDVLSSTPSEKKPDFFKPQQVVHSLTSRKTAPVTLYSTVAKPIKQ